MTEHSQMPLVGPPKRRGWAEIVWFRPLTASTHATLVVTRRGRLASILPANGPRVLSDYLAWPYDFREVDTRERLLTLDQRLESFDSSYEFIVSLRLIYQVVRPDRVALELDDVSTELTHAVVQSLRLSGRSFGVEQDKTFEEHLQETLITGDALAQRVQLLGLVLHRVDVIVTLDEPTRAHAEALRFAMRERPLHFQLAIESLESDRSFDVHVVGAYRLTERRAQDEPGDVIDSAIQTAIARTLRRTGMAFEPSDYPNAAKAMAEVLRKDVLLQSELAMVHAQLLRPTVQIQPDRSMVHVPRPSMLNVPEMRPEPTFRRSRQSLPRPGRPPALEDMQERAPQSAPAPTVRRALPAPATQSDESAARWAVPSSVSQPAESAASPTLPLGELPAPGEPSEGAYTRWPSPAVLPTMRALPTSGQLDTESDGRAPWADLIRSNDDPADDIPWMDEPAVSLSAPVEPLPWDRLEGADQPMLEEQPHPWVAGPPATLRAPVEPLPWERSDIDGDVDQPALGVAFAFEEAKNSSPAVSEPAPAPPAPARLDSELADDLGFSLDWSEPEVAQAADSATNVGTPVADDFGFSLDWSDPQIDPYVGVQLPSAKTIADNSMVTAHWNDQDMAVSEPTLFGDPPSPAYDSASAAAGAPDRWSAAELDQIAPVLQQVEPERSPDVMPQDAQQDETLAFAEQEASPWYAPTLHFDEQLPFDSSVDAPTYGMAWATPAPSEEIAANTPADASLEAFGTAWADAPIASELSVEVGTAPADVPLELFGPAGADALVSNAPSEEIAANAPLESLAVAWADAPTPSEPADAMAADANIPPLDHALNTEPPIEAPNELALADASDLIVAHVEPAAEISPELIARLIGMIQSYGPAWFKMWSLELKERPERLPVVLGEVTADPLLLAQAGDARVQSALLAALAAYTSPPVHPARLSSASLPSPVMASQSNDDDEVPDWLSLRTKWNGHGGSA